MRSPVVVLSTLAFLGVPFSAVPVPPLVSRLDARISVRVIGISGDGAEQVLRDAQVQLTSVGTGPEIELTRWSDDGGQVAFDRLPAGMYIVEASRIGYVRTVFGARRHDMPGAAVALRDGDAIDLRLPLPKASAISGTVSAPTGGGAYAVSVSLFESRLIAGVKRFVTANRARAAGAVITASTDATGGYRMYGLPRGEYIVRAVARAATPNGSIGSSAVYFPSTEDLDGATIVPIGVGDERTGVDLQLRRPTLVSVAGTVGPPLSSTDRIRVVLLPHSVAPNVVSASNGRFVFEGVSPGQYTLWARSIPNVSAPFAAEDPGPAVWGTSEVSVGAAGATDIRIALNPSMTFGGRVRLDSKAPGPLSLEGADIALSPVEAVNGISYVRRVPGHVSAIGEFNLRGVTPGRYFVEAGLREPAGRTFRLASVLLGGQEVLGLPIDFLSNQSPRDVVLTLSDAIQQLSGVLEDHGGRHPLGCSVILFAADPRFWTSPSGRVRTSVPATDGRFSFVDIPVGDYWLGAAADLGPDDETDPTFLRSLAGASVALTIERGARKVQNLRITGGQPC